jgi:arylsulfatase A-like enzyme
MRLLLLFLLAPFLSIADTTTVKPLVSHQVVYKTQKASEVYLVWTMDNWKIPDIKFQPSKTYVNNGMAYSKMSGNKDSFSIDLQLPKGIYMDFMIWASKDLKGDSIQGWDNNWGNSYNVFVDGKKTKTTLTDEKLYIAEKAKPKQFNLLEHGSTILWIGSAFAFFGLLFLFFTKQQHKVHTVTPDYFVTGLLLSTLIIMLISRLQITGYISHQQYKVFGVGYYDILLTLVFSAFALLLLYLTRKRKAVHTFSIFFLSIIILAAGLFSVMNIEIVRQLGKPITYNWLYYSDFLRGADAKNAMKASASPTLVKNIAFIFIGVLLAAFGLSVLSQFLYRNAKTSGLAAALVLIAIFVTSLFQFKKEKVEFGKVENPFSAFVLSWVGSGEQSELFTMKVSPEIEQVVEQMHAAVQTKKLPYANRITNIVVFVFESTPANLVQLYDSTYKVTPNVNKWKQHAIIYNNMYAHLPTTANTMLSLISGIYPMINYKSIVNEYPGIKIPSLPALLKSNGWRTSLFFSSDLSYSNMYSYLKNQQIETAEDFKTIPCMYDGFNSNYAKLDGLDDRCMVNRYFEWRNNIKESKGLSILWSNQTHYPYFFSGKEKKFSDKPELNKYLNALEEVDNAFGELMNGLEKRKELNKTLVILVGDHGEAFGTHGQFTHGANIYEENMRVPCLLINPILFKGERDSSISGMIDIAPTIAHAAAFQQPKEWEGRSLLSSVKRDHAFFIGPYSDFQFGSRFQNWKLIYNAANNQFKLFDLAKDPGELNNLADKNQEIVRKEYQLMAGWVQYHNKKLTTFINTR